MGISSSTQKTDTTQSQNTNQTQNATTTPVAPAWLTGAAQDYVGRIGAFGNTDPNSYVAPASPLHQAAWQNALPALSGWQGQAHTAADMANHYGNSGPNFGGNAAQASSTGYNSPQLPSASLVSANGYSAPNLGNATGYAAARTGSPIGATTSSYNPTSATSATVGPTTNGTASGAGAASTRDNMGYYQNPWNDQVVNTTLADFDHNAGRQLAANAAAGARDNAFGGSRFGIEDAELQGNQGRARATLEAGLRQQGFNTAAGLGQADAANQQQSNLFNAQNQTGVSLANAGAANAANLAQAGFRQQGNMYNAEAGNQASQFGAAAGNQASLFNAGQANQHNQFQAGLDTGANAANAAAQNQFGLQQGQFAQNAGQFNAGAQNAASAANAAAQNQFGLSQAGFNANAGQFGAAAANQAGLFNAGAQNDMSRFNAGQADLAANRGLMGANQLQSGANAYDANARGDLGTMAQLGDQQRQIEQGYALAPLAQLQAMGSLSGATPYQILTGQNVNGTNVGTMTGTGTEVKQTTPSLFSQLLAAGQVAGSFIPGG